MDQHKGVQVSRRQQPIGPVPDLRKQQRPDIAGKADEADRAFLMVLAFLFFMFATAVGTTLYS